MAPQYDGWFAAGSDEAETPVDGEDLAGDVARLVGQQEHRGGGHLPGRALPAEGHGRDGARRATRRRAPAERRVDQPGRDDVGAHTPARAFDRHVAAEADEPGL